MNTNMSIYQFHRPTGTHLEPPKSSNPIIASSFEIDPKYIEFVQKQPFSGEGKENSYTHLREFYRVCDLLRIEGMSDETLKWKVFPFSLTGKARHWYKLKVGSVHRDWKELYNSFLFKYFPISKWWNFGLRFFLLDNWKKNLSANHGTAILTLLSLAQSFLFHKKFF